MRRLSEEASVHETARIRDARLGRYTEIGEGARLLDVDLGDYSYCDRFADMAHARIDKMVSIASFVRINPGDHPMERAAQHHFMYRASIYWDDAEDEPAIFERRADRPVTIGPDVWIGANSVVLSGRVIGAGAVLGAGSVLTKNIPPYEIWAGAPARKIRDRHPRDIAERLQALAWWEWDHARLRAALEDFRTMSVEAFLDRHE